MIYINSPQGWTKKNVVLEILSLTCYHLDSFSKRYTWIFLEDELVCNSVRVDSVGSEYSHLLSVPQLVQSCHTLSCHVNSTHNKTWHLRRDWAWSQSSWSEMESLPMIHLLDLVHKKYLTETYIKLRYNTGI